MEQYFSFISASTIGFLGSLHCIGMCGGISAALNSNNAQNTRQQCLFQLLYNTGRIFSYFTAGMLAGLFGSVVDPHLNLHGVSILRLFAGVMMILLGLYLSGWWMILTRVERAGAILWKYISPMTRQLIPANTPSKALFLGLLWGWLPCGLVYSALTLSTASAAPIESGLMMVCFGLGTLPAMMATGMLGNVISTVSRSTTTRTIASILMIVYGSWTILGHINMDHSAHSNTQITIESKLNHATPIESVDHSHHH